MNKAVKMSWLLPAFFATMAIAGTTFGQGMQIGEVLILNSPSVKKDSKPDAFKAYISDEASLSSQKPGVGMYVFQADRGDKKGEYLLVCDINKSDDRKSLPTGSPFTEKSLSSIGAKSNLTSHLANPQSYTEYRLIGAEKFNALPMAGILGIHYIQVKKHQSEAFEKFVVDKLHPAVGNLLPDMQLMYYKAVDGEGAGSYITIFVIESVAARDKYWPGGTSETEILKQTFRPLNDLAKELGTYLVEGSFLAPESGGAAAYFESKKWTDFIHQGSLK